MDVEVTGVMQRETFSAPPPEVILPRLGPTAEEKVLVEERTFRLLRPAQSDKLLDDPAVESAFNLDEYMPYWADIWPAARMLAKVVLRERWPPGLHALEIGCGLGLAGLAALACGLEVTFTDYDACALHFVEKNARLNGFGRFQTLQLDWRQPPAGLQAAVILGSDLIYEMRNVEPLVRFLKIVLRPNGICLLTDQDRIPAEALRATLTAEGLAFTTQLVRAGEPGGRRLKGTLYRIRHADVK